MRFSWIGLGVGLALLLGAGCDDLNIENTPFACASDDECLSGFACVGGVCVNTSADASDTTTGGQDGFVTENCPGGCSFANGTGECRNGACALVTCDSNFSNCDGNASNGCETNLLVQKLNCGRCGAACGSDEVCNLGVCSTETATTCASFFSNNECEVSEQCLPVSADEYQCVAFGTNSIGEACTQLNQCERGSTCLGDVCTRLNCAPSGSPSCKTNEICVPLNLGGDPLDVGICQIQASFGEPCGGDTGKSCQSEICLLGANDTTYCSQSCSNDVGCPAEYRCDTVAENQMACVLRPDPTSCLGIYECIIACEQDQACSQACVSAGDSETQQRYITFNNCLAESGCTDNDCFYQQCGAEIEACLSDRG